MDPDATELQRALDHHEFFPAFQPIVELRTGQLTGFELLARWQHATPDEFIPRIEGGRTQQLPDSNPARQGLRFGPLSNSALHLSCQSFSRSSYRTPEFPPSIAACAEQAHFSLTRLTIEVTESALLKDLARRQRHRQQAKEAGLPPRARRLRHRLFQPAASAVPPLRQAQSGSKLRRLHDRGPGKPQNRGGCHRPRPESRARHRGRRGRNPCPGQHAALARLRSRPRLALWQACPSRRRFPA